MMQGLDAQFDGVVFVGYHAGTTNPTACAPTFSSAAAAWLNGVTVNEGVWAPPSRVTSNCRAGRQRRRSGREGSRGAGRGSETAVVKWPLAFHPRAPHAGGVAESQRPCAAALERRGERRPTR
jgi:hypothetical protein